MAPSLSARLPFHTTMLLVGALALAGSWAAWDALGAAVAALVVLMALPLLHRLATRQPIDPLDALWPFLACYGVSFALKPFLLMAGILTYPWTNIDRPAATVGVIWATVALAFLYLGYWGWRPARAAAWLNTVCAERSITGVRVGAALVSLGGVFGIAAIAVLGGVPPTPEMVFSERFREVAFQVVYGRGYLTMLISLSVFGPAAQCYAALETRSVLDRGLCALWFLLVTAAVLCFYSRALLLSVFILFLVVLHFKGRWFKPRSLIIMGTALLLFGGALGLRRIQNDNSPIAALPAPLAAVAFLGSTFDSFEFLVPAVQRLSFFGELSGQSLFEDVFWTFVPRALFPNKPDTYGSIVVQNVLMADLAYEGAQYGTYPAGFLVEWYVNFGIFGFLFIALAYGAMLRVAGAVVLNGEPRLIPLLVYGGVVLNLVGLFRSSSQTLVQAALYTALLLLIFARWPALPRLGRIGARAATSPPVS